MHCSTYSEYTCQLTLQTNEKFNYFIVRDMRERSSYVVYFIFFLVNVRKVQNYMNFVGVVGNPPRCSLWHLLISDLNLIIVSLAIFTLSFKSTISA